MQKQNLASIPLFLHILSIFLPSSFVFSLFCLVSAIYLPIFLPFLPVFESSFSNFCSMLRLAEHCDTKEWYISLTEQNWRIWPPLRGYFLAEQDWVLAEKNCWPPLKNAPRTPMIREQRIQGMLLSLEIVKLNHILFFVIMFSLLVKIDFYFPPFQRIMKNVVKDFLLFVRDCLQWYGRPFIWILSMLPGIQPIYVPTFLFFLNK